MKIKIHQHSTTSAFQAWLPEKVEVPLTYISMNKEGFKHADKSK